MHLLPTNLGPLANLTESDGRFALGNVRLRVHGDNTFLAEATDTKVLLRVSGPCVADSGEFPDGVPGLDSAPNGKVEALIPATAWKKTFTAAKKLTARTRTAALRSVAVKIGGTVTTFGATDATSHQCEAVGNAEGRFPPTGDILNNRRDGPVTTTFAVDPILLAELLKTIAATACDDDDARVEFEVKKPNRPITIRAGNRANGLRAHAIIMPLTDGRPTAPADGDDTEEAEPSAAVIALEKQLGIVTADRDALKEVADERIAQVLDCGATITDLRAQIAQLKELLASREDRIAELTRTGNTTAPALPTRPRSRAERLAHREGVAS